MQKPINDDWIKLVQATILLKWFFGMVELLGEGSSLYVLQNFSLSAYLISLRVMYFGTSRFNSFALFCSLLLTFRSLS